MKRTLALFLALTLSLSLLAGCGGQEAQSTPAPTGTTAPTATPDAEEPTTKVVVDGLGREVEIPWPVERAVVANRYNSELIRACGAIDRVIAVDALASRRVGRVCCTVQFSDTGIIPGSGVGNHRSALNRETLGVPVLAVGVPTVVDAATLAADLLEESGLPEPDMETLRSRPENLMVTPRDIDQQVRDLGKVIGYGINWALQDLKIEEINALLS